jgi:hypothetical protein
MKFLHFRYVDINDGPDTQTDTVRTKGGKTIAYEAAEGKLKYSIARCADRENFCRRTGRLVSSGRFNHGQVFVVENFDPTKQSPIHYLYQNEGAAYYDRKDQK